MADVIPAKGEKVEGALYLVSMEDLKALDRYEGYPTLYDRHEITVTTPSREPWRRSFTGCSTTTLRPRRLTCISK